MWRGLGAFAERVLPRASDQEPFFLGGIAFDGTGFVRTAVTAPAFSYLRPIEAGNKGLVDQNSASWNLLSSWLRQIGGVWRSGDAHRSISLNPGP
jgi:hypothetical protein